MDGAVGERDGRFRRLRELAILSPVPRPGLLFRRHRLLSAGPFLLLPRRRPQRAPESATPVPLARRWRGLLRHQPSPRVHHHGAMVRAQGQRNNLLRRRDPTRLLSPIHSVGPRRLLPVSVVQQQRAGNDNLSRSFREEPGRRTEGDRVPGRRRCCATGGSNDRTGERGLTDERPPHGGFCQRQAV